jgi:hypothetical protein
LHLTLILDGPIEELTGFLSDPKIERQSLSCVIMIDNDDQVKQVVYKVVYSHDVALVVMSLQHN